MNERGPSMLTDKKRAADPAQVAAPKIVPQRESYRGFARRSRGNLKDQVGLLLLRLQGPMKQRQRVLGWSLFEVLLAHYLAGRESAR
jgi:hypothetical protein